MKLTATIGIHSLVLFLVLVLSIGGMAQSPVLQFRSDSVQVGEHTQIILYFDHNKEQEVLFPDSNFNYAPFEFVSKRYFSTKSTDSLSRDSVVYTLATYEMEGTLTLAIPAFVFKDKDTLRVFSNTDSIAIQPLITAVNDTLKLQSNTQPLSLERHFNYLIVIVLVVLFIGLAILVYLAFGKKIWHLIKKYRSRITHLAFLNAFDHLVGPDKKPTSAKMEEATALWKRYMENLEGKPYTTYTSSEIAYHLKNENLRQHLKSIDVAIYGNRSADVTSEDFKALREVAIQLYQQSQTPLTK